MSDVNLSNPMVCDYPASYHVSDNGTFKLFIYEDGSIYLINEHRRSAQLLPMRHVRELRNMLSQYVNHLDEVDGDDIPF